MQLPTYLALAIALGACGKSDTRDDRPDTGERAYLDGELAKLTSAITANREPDMVIGCVSVRTSRKRMPPEVVAKIDQLCDLEVPRRLFENAIASAKTDLAKAPPEMKQLGCMQLMVSDAYEAFARQTPPDPGLAKLAAGYAEICPEAAAKAQAKATAKAARSE